ncbi:MAG: hypothetical protein HRU69_07030 [Flammeovirgaceae bacterium]|nr:MAG: hypothetical protein HRU69_07030 [Flammeovirgaceae bacterium]
MLFKMLLPVVLLVGSLVAGMFFSGNQKPAMEQPELPEGTIYAEHSLAYVLNNEQFISSPLQTQVHYFDQSVCLSFRSGADAAERLSFVVNTTALKPGTYLLNEPGEAYVHFQLHRANCLYTSDEFYQGVLTITGHDEEQSIISGMFEFLAYSQTCNTAIRCTNGRFTASYSVY